MPYTLVDMTRDVVALLDHLVIGRAHVVGASMGGMIAQILAATEPDRVASLAIIMSTTGKPFSRLPAWRVIRLAFNSPGDDASDEEKLAFEVRNIAVFNGPNFLPSEAELRKRVQQLAERSNYPPGMLRQFDAVLGTGSLLGYSKAITAPTVVRARFARPDGAAAQRPRRSPRPSPVPGSSSSTAWAMTSPNRCGVRSSRPSPRTLPERPSSERAHRNWDLPTPI